MEVTHTKLFICDLSLQQKVILNTEVVQEFSKMGMGNIVTKSMALIRIVNSLLGISEQRECLSGH